MTAARALECRVQRVGAEAADCDFAGVGSARIGKNACVSAATAAAGFALISIQAGAQHPADLDAVKAAHHGFYKALSGSDLKAMVDLWADKPYVVNIGPRSKSVLTGYADAVTNYWPVTFQTFSTLNVSSSIVQAHSNGTVAWVIGTETAVLQPRAGGDPVKFETMVTNIFEKQGARWLMTSHHAQIIPK